MPNELKPCPFCGYEYPTIRHNRITDSYSICCPDCQIVFRNDCTAARDMFKKTSITAWNRRANDEAE